MKVKIDVDNKQQGEIIAAALQDETMRAFVLVTGALKPLSERGRRRVLEFVRDVFEERANKGNGPYKSVDGVHELAIEPDEIESAEQGANR
jgi:hypothetical protein